jgi:uncharacterized damage-inducible protein DinB
VTFSSIACTHFRYNRWASAQVLEEVLPLPAEQLVRDFKGSFAGIYPTLAHLYQTDTIWLERLQGIPAGDLSRYEPPGCTFELKDAWQAVQEKMLSWAEGLPEDGWEGLMQYRSMAGAPFETPLWQMALHIVNHGSYHRGQITSMLRQLGVKPANLDLIGYYRATQNSVLASP